MNGEENMSGERKFWHDVDIEASRVAGNFDGGETPEEISATYVDDARSYLSGKAMETDELRIKELIEGLDTAIAINNNPEARSLRKEFERRYRLEVILQ